MVIKTSDTTIQSDNTVNDDTELRFAVQAGYRYCGYAMIFVTSGTTPDFKYNFSVPVGATGYRLDAALSGAAMGTATSITTEKTGIATTGSRQCIFIPFFIKTASTAGEVIFRWAQNTSTASNTTVHEGSFIMVDNRDSF